MTLKYALLGSMTLASASAFAGIFYFPPTYTPGLEKDQSQKTTSAYAGLVWTLKEKKSLIPDLTVGIRSLQVKSSEQVSGADLSARIRLSDGLAIESVRLSYVGGQRTSMGMAGIGYSMTSATMLSTFAVQRAFARLGVDYAFGPARLTPYVEGLTIGNPAKVNKLITPGTYSCPPGSMDFGNQCGYQM